MTVADRKSPSVSSPKQPNFLSKRSLQIVRRWPRRLRKKQFQPITLVSYFPQPLLSSVLFLTFCCQMPPPESSPSTSSFEVVIFCPTPQLSPSRISPRTYHSPARFLSHECTSPESLIPPVSVFGCVSHTDVYRAQEIVELAEKKPASAASAAGKRSKESRESNRESNRESKDDVDESPHAAKAAKITGFFNKASELVEVE